MACVVPAVFALEAASVLLNELGVSAPEVPPPPSNFCPIPASLSLLLCLCPYCSQNNLEEQVSAWKREVSRVRPEKDAE